jgi:AraC-like DNA-binding protein
MKPIPLIGAERVSRFASLLDDAGAPVSRYLEAAGISPEIQGSPVGFVPGQAAWRFLNTATASSGLRDLCLDVAGKSNWKRAGWVRPLASAVTLEDAIQAMCHSYVQDIPMIKLGLQTNGPVAWFWRRRTTNVRGWDGNDPAEQYMLSFMLELVRVGAGSDWQPDGLMLESAPDGWAADTRALPGVRIAFDQPQLALAIPLELLSLPVSIVPASVEALEGEPSPQDFVDSVRRVVAHWIAVGLPTQEQAAERLQVSPRTLRRNLADGGTCWRALVHDALFAAAIVRLQGDAPVRELAEEFGFSDAANFTRFFRSRAGVPPSAYRDTLMQANELICQRQA